MPSVTKSVPAQKFGLFETAGGRTATGFVDRLLAHTPILNKPLQILAKNRRTIIRDVQIETTSNHMHYCDFWNFQRAKEHPGEWSKRTPMWQDCSLTAVQRNTAFVEQS